MVTTRKNLTDRFLLHFHICINFRLKLALVQISGDIGRQCTIEFKEGYKLNARTVNENPEDCKFICSLKQNKELCFIFQRMQR